MYFPLKNVTLNLQFFSKAQCLIFWFVYFWSFTNIWYHGCIFKQFCDLESLQVLQINQKKQTFTHWMLGGLLLLYLKPSAYGANRLQKILERNPDPVVLGEQQYFVWDVASQSTK